MSKKERSFNVVLGDDDYARLEDLGEEFLVSKGAVIRMLIVHAHRMRVKGQALCADGQACFVPHMHVRR
ncbi:hypothetical protein ES703_64647 [subsurface metagenome]